MGVRLRFFGKKVLFRGWRKPRARSGLFKLDNQIRPIRHIKRYYRMTVRRFIQFFGVFAIGLIMGSEEVVVGLGCFGGVWLVRHFSRELFNRNNMVYMIRNMYRSGLVGVERCVTVILVCIFDFLKVEEELNSRDEMECEVFLVRYSL